MKYLPALILTSFLAGCGDSPQEQLHEKKLEQQERIEKAEKDVKKGKFQKSPPAKTSVD